MITKYSLHLAAAFTLLLFLGCATEVNNPDLEYISRVLAVGSEEIKNDRSKTVDDWVNGYSNFGIRLKELSRLGVNPELARITDNWADASLRLSDSLSQINGLASDDTALVENIARIAMGENPIVLLDREDARMTHWKKLESSVMQHLQAFNAAKAEFRRCTKEITATATPHELRSSSLPR